MAAGSIAVLSGMMTGARTHPQPYAGVGLPLHAELVTAHALQRGDVGVLHDRAGEGREVRRRVAQLAGDGRGAIRRYRRDVPGGPRGWLHERRRGHVVETEPGGVALRAVARDALVPGSAHDVRGVVARGRMALRARRVGRDVVGRLAAGGYVAAERRRRRMAAVAVTGGRVRLVER